MKETTGKVYIVGAGPGDLKLMTIRGMELLKRADVVLYDYLSSKSLLLSAKDGCELVDVGKCAGKHMMPQEDINNLLVEKALQGKTVVRLKGGDPFVFGRGAEEILPLVEKNIPFEVVPGVTAAIAGPAYAGIPVTYRHYTQTLTFVAGHEADGKSASSVPWEALAKLGGTIAFYMGVKNLKNNLERLIGFGMDPNRPAAFIRWATTNWQKTYTGTVSNLSEVIPESEMKSPALVLVGDVVKFRESMKWFEKRPLFGKTVLLTRAREQASELAELLMEMGAECIELPTIRITPPEDYAPLDRAVKGIAEFDWVIFTSVNGVDHFFERLEKTSADSRALQGLKIGSVGPATTKRLASHGIKADFQPSKFETKMIVDEMKGRKDVKGTKILLPRSDIAPKELAKGLESIGARVTEVCAYMTKDVEDERRDIRELLDLGCIDCLTFASSSTVKNFFKWLGRDNLNGLKKRPAVASIGPVTAETLKSYGILPEIEANESTIPSLAEAVAKHFVKRS